MPGKRRPLPHGYWDAQRIVEEANKRGAPLKLKTVKWHLKHKPPIGTTSELHHPQHRYIVPEEGGRQIIERAARKISIQQMVQRGELTRLDTLAKQLGLKERSLHGADVKTIFDGTTRWVDAKEAQRVRKLYAEIRRVRQNFISPKRAGAEIGVAQQTIVKWINAGLIPAETVVVKGQKLSRIPTGEWNKIKNTIKERAGYHAEFAKPGKRKVPKPAVIPEQKPTVERVLTKAERIAMIKEIVERRKRNRGAFEKELAWHEINAEDIGTDVMARVEKELRKHLGEPPEIFKTQTIPRLLKIISKNK